MSIIRKATLLTISICCSFFLCQFSIANSFFEDGRIVSTKEGVVFEKASYIKDPNGRGYLEVTRKGVAVIEEPTGARSGQFPVVHHNKVIKSAIKKGLFNNLKKAKGLRAGWVGWACMIACPYLAEKGYEWMNDLKCQAGNTDYCPDYARKPNSEDVLLCLYTVGVGTNSRPCGANNNLSKRQWSGGEIGDHDTVCKKWGPIGVKFLYSDSEITGIRFNESFLSCVVYYRLKNGTNSYASFSIDHQKVIDPIRLSEDEFNSIIDSHIDENPTELANAARPAQDKPLEGMENDGVSLDSDSPVTVQTQPYTNPITGKVEQITYNITNNNDNRINIVRTVTQRPDLKPDSAEAPVPTPPKTDDKNDTKNETEQKDASAPDACDKHPDILACDKIPDKAPDASDIEFQKKEVNLSFAPAAIFPTDGTCPVGPSFSAFGETYTISAEPACLVAQKLRPWIILMAWLIAAFFVVSTINKET